MTNKVVTIDGEKFELVMVHADSVDRSAKAPVYALQPKPVEL